jgi:3-methyladenine DNA glycosylase AlkD
MITTEQLISELTALASPVIAKSSQRFFKTEEGQYGAGDKFYGIRNAALRTLSKNYQALPLDNVFSLLDHDYHETRLVAVFILVLKYQRSKNEAEKQRICDMYIQESIKINNWDLVDSSAYKILGPHLLDKDKAILYQLAESTNLWQRRIAIITTMYFIKKDHFDDTLRLAELYLQDKEDLIHKASGWMLREIGKRDKTITLEFLNRFATSMPRTMLRYTIEKFTPEERKHYMQK